MFVRVFDVKDVIIDDVVDDDTSKDANDDEDTGFGKDFSEEGHVMEDDFEQDGRDDHHGEHD